MPQCKKSKEIKEPKFTVTCPKCNGSGQEGGASASLQGAASCSLCWGCGVLLIHCHNGAPHGALH
jgi:DnaJ-class molecular chaperone